MTIGGGAPIDRPVQLERAANVGRCEAEDVGQDLLELFLVDLAGSVGIDQDRHRVGNADGIGDLDGAALGDAGRDHVLGEIARRIGRGAVDLGRVLAGERAAAVRSVAAVGIDDDLAAGQPAVAIGTADDEIAGWIDQEVGRLLRHPAVRQRGGYSGLDQVLHHRRRILLAVAGLGVVLRRDHDLGAADRLAVDVLHRHLALGVGLQVEQLAGAPLVRQHLQNAVGEEDRRRHEGVLLVDLALGAGEAEHHALIAGAFLLAVALLLGVDTHRDVGRLAVQEHLDVGAVKGKAFLVVADIFDDIAGDLHDHVAIDVRLAAVFVEQRRLAAAFARDDDLVGGAQRLAAKPRVDLALVGNAELDVVGDEGVENGVRDLIADLVGMPFRNGFAGEQIVRA